MLNFYLRYPREWGIWEWYFTIWMLVGALTDYTYTWLFNTVSAYVVAWIFFRPHASWENAQRALKLNAFAFAFLAFCQLPSTLALQLKITGLNGFLASATCGLLISGMAGIVAVRAARVGFRFEGHEA